MDLILLLKSTGVLLLTSKNPLACCWNTAMCPFLSHCHILGTMFRALYMKPVIHSALRTYPWRRGATNRKEGKNILNGDHKGCRNEHKGKWCSLGAKPSLKTKKPSCNKGEVRSRERDLPPGSVARQQGTKHMHIIVVGVFLSLDQKDNSTAICCLGRKCSREEEEEDTHVGRKTPLGKTTEERSWEKYLAEWIRHVIMQ